MTTPLRTRTISGLGRGIVRSSAHIDLSRPAAETPDPGLVIRNCLLQLWNVEIGPECFSHEEFGVRRLPEQEIAGPLLAGRADYEVGIGQFGVVQTSVEGGFVDSKRVQPIGHQLSDRVHHLSPAAIVEADVEHAAAVGCRPLHRLSDLVPHSRRESFQAPAEENPDATLVQLVQFPAHALVEKAHQRAYLGARPRPVLGRKRVDGEKLNTHLFAAAEDPPNGFDARAMTEAVRTFAQPGPTPVAVHDDPDVAGILGPVQGGLEVTCARGRAMATALALAYRWRRVSPAPCEH